MLYFAAGVLRQGTYMLATAIGDVRMAIPIWGSIVLTLVGAAYLVLGMRWRRFFDVLSMTILGSIVGLAACAWVPLAQPLVIVAGGLVFGGLTAFFRNVCHAILAAVVFAVVLATLAALAVGPRGFASYLAINVSSRSYSIQLSGPNLACDAVLAAGLAGVLAGVTISAARFQLSERLLMSVEGAALMVIGLAAIVSAWRGEGGPSVATAFPLTLGVFWLCLVVIGLVVQGALERRRKEWRLKPEESEGLES